MRKYLLLLPAFIAVFAIIKCGPSTLPATDEGEIPSWYLNTPEDPNYIFAPATATSKDLQLCVDKATTDARAEVGRQVEVKIEGLRKKFDEEVGVGENATLLQQFTAATKTVVSLSLSGSKVSQKKVMKDGDNWRSYVLVQYPIGAANDAFLQQVKKNEELYTRFRSSQAFKELEDDVKKYEDSKKE